MMHISNGSCEALSAAFLLWDQPGALDADVLTTNEILVIVILWISILQTAPNILLSHSRGVLHLVWLTEFVLIPLFFAFKLVTWLKKNKTFWPILLNRVCQKCVFLIFATMARKVMWEGIFPYVGKLRIGFNVWKIHIFAQELYKTNESTLIGNLLWFPWPPRQPERKKIVKIIPNL